MLLVKTTIGPSALEGLGLFADEFIPEGTEIAKFVDGFDQVFTVEEVNALSPIARDHVLRYSYLCVGVGVYVHVADHSRFTNHSDDPNTLDMPGEGLEGSTVAARDILRGEEITVDYREFDIDADKKLGGVLTDAAE